VSYTSQRHPISDLALRLLGDASAFAPAARRDLTAAWLAAAATEGFGQATRSLIELSTALRAGGRARAAATLAVLVLSGAPLLRRRSASLATRRTERAAAGARLLGGPEKTPLPADLAHPPPAGAIKASPLARFIAAPRRANLEEEE
jgi:hypothetical protein